MQLSLQKVYTVRTYNYSTDAPLMTLKFLKDATFTNGSENSLLTQNGSAIASIDHSKSCTLAGSSSVIDEALLSLQVGSNIQVLTNTTEIRIQETIVTTVANQATITYTATGTAGATIKYADLVDSDGTIIKSFVEMTGTATTGKFTVASKVLTFFAGEVPIGSRIRVSYYPTVASARKIQNLATNLSAVVRAEIEVSFMDACTSQERKGLIVLPKAKFSGAFDWATAEAGDFATHAFELTSLKTCDTEKLWDMYTFDGTAITV